MEVDPLSIILVKSDSKGDRLLCRYPYRIDTKTDVSMNNMRKNPYSIIQQEDILQSPPRQTSNIRQGFHYYINFLLFRFVSTFSHDIHFNSR